jgi:hypothetical protein
MLILNVVIRSFLQSFIFDKIARIIPFEDTSRNQNVIIAPESSTHRLRLQRTVKF